MNLACTYSIACMLVSVLRAVGSNKAFPLRAVASNHQRILLGRLSLWFLYDFSPSTAWSLNANVNKHNGHAQIQVQVATQIQVDARRCTQMHTDTCRRMRTHADAHRHITRQKLRKTHPVCGRTNLKTHLDTRHLFKDSLGCSSCSLQLEIIHHYKCTYTWPVSSD